MKELKQKVYKAIKPKCEFCDGTGVSWAQNKCPDCNGLGYILELEGGCEVEMKYEGITKKVTLNSKPWVAGKCEMVMDKYGEKFCSCYISKVFGKPLTLQDILLALAQKGGVTFIYPTNIYDFGIMTLTTDYYSIKIDLKKTPQEYDQDLIDELKEIL